MSQLNSQVVHGIPNSEIVNEGDILSIDCGVLKNGYYGDHAYTFGVGEIDPEVERLLQTTKESLYVGIEQFIVLNSITNIPNSVPNFKLFNSYIKRFFSGL